MINGRNRRKLKKKRYCSAPSKPNPFSPVHKHRKFSAVLGTTSLRSSITIRPIYLQGIQPHIAENGERSGLSYLIPILTPRYTLGKPLAVEAVPSPSLASAIPLPFPYLFNHSSSAQTGRDDLSVALGGLAKLHLKNGSTLIKIQRHYVLAYIWDYWIVYDLPDRPTK